MTTTPEEGYHYADRAKIEDKITERTKAILLANPGNPTGTVLTKDERRLICDIAKENDLFIIADEVYREFIYNGEEASSFGQYDDVADRTVVIDSVSKRYSACGARIGALISKNKELQNQVMKLLQGRLCVSTLDQVGSAALYRLDAAYYEEVKAEYQRRRDVVYKALSEIDGVVCKEPPGAFYIMAKLPVESAEDFLIYMLTEFSDDNETTMFAPAEGFYDTPGLGGSEIRIAYMLNLNDMKRAMEILQKGLAAYLKKE
jgi:aspartate aminotransferase